MNGKVDIKSVLKSNKYSITKLKIRNTNLDVKQITDPMLKLVNDKLPLINLSLVEDLNYDLITDLAEYDNENEELDDDIKPSYLYSIDELSKLNYESKLTKKFDQFFIDNYPETSSNYYTYSNAYLDDKNDLKIFYTGKGIGERSVNAFRTAYACYRLNVRPDTERIKFIIKKLLEKKDVEVIKTNENLANHQALAIETCGFKIDYKIKQSNISESSINLNQINLEKIDETIKNINIRTINRMINKHNSKDYDLMRLDNLAKDYETKFAFSLNKMNKNTLYERKISSIIYLLAGDFDEDKKSELTNKQKLIILTNVLIYINDNKALSNLAIKKLFAKFLEKETNVRNSFNKYVKRLLYSPNSNQELLDILNKLNDDLFNGDFNEFKSLFETIVDQTRLLLNDKDNRRRLGARFSLEEQYTLYKILEYSLENDQLLSGECNELIYSKILGEAANHTRHEISCRIFQYKSKRHLSPKISKEDLTGERRKQIKTIIKREYDLLAKDTKNHFQVNVPFTPEQNHAIYYIQQLNKEFESTLTFENYEYVYRHCLNLEDDEPVNRKTLGLLISENRKRSSLLANDSVRRKQIEDSCRAKYVELSEMDKRKVKKKTRYTDETKYVALKLVDMESPPTEKDIVRIVNICGIKDRPLVNKALKRPTFYTALPSIDSDNQTKYDKIIDSELAKLKSRAKFNSLQKATHDCKRGLINGTIIRQPGVEQFNKIIESTASTSTATTSTNARKRKDSKDDSNLASKKKRKD